MADPVDDSHHRAVLAQTAVSESRHALARHVFHGRCKQLSQPYRDGREDQLGALGLVVNAIVLWNTAAAQAHDTFTSTPPILGGTLHPLREPRPDDEDEE